MAEYDRGIPKSVIVAANMPASPELVCIPDPARNPYLRDLMPTLTEIRYHWGTMTDEGLTPVGITGITLNGNDLKAYELDPDTCLALKHILAQEGVSADSVVPML